MTLDEQIRERLAKRLIVFPGMSSNMREHYRERFDQMADALLAVVEYATPGEPFPGEGDSRDHAEKAIDAEVEAVLAHVLGLIAEGLGIEVERA